MVSEGFYKEHLKSIESKYQHIKAFEMF